MNSILFSVYFAWLFNVIESANYAVLMDGGSTGTRVYIYKWLDKAPLDTIDEVARKRTHPGLSSFVHNPNHVEQQISNLLETAKKYVPRNQWSVTPVSLKATAGLRSLSILQQHDIIQAAQRACNNSVFSFQASHTRVISGKEEALYDWLAVNVAYKTYKTGEYYGAVDMGGSSKQIAYAISTSTYNSYKNTNYPNNHSQPMISSISSQCTPDWMIHLPQHGIDQSIAVYSRSVTGFGLIDSMNDLLFTNITNSDMTTTHCLSDGHGEHIDSCREWTHPCLAPGEYPPGEIHRFDFGIFGAGNFNRCRELIKQLLIPKSVNVVNPECVKAHKPSNIIGMDNFPKLFTMLHLDTYQPENIDISVIEKRGISVCNRPWQDLLDDFPGYQEYRAQRACFGAAYIYVLMTEMYGLERKELNELNESIEISSYKKNNHIDLFAAVDSIGDHELSWALGAAVYLSLGYDEPVPYIASEDLYTEGLSSSDSVSEISSSPSRANILDSTTMKLVS
mmetsp:Transcript_3643/g.3760  ORF Transcript_3643/g.3760 Transcript_3643/m.3760 type:complete len:507 (+) Transcript_3643:166-1686(+)